MSREYNTKQKELILKYIKDNREKHVYLEHRFKIDSKKTVFYGICEECEKVEKSSPVDKNEA